MLLDAADSSPPGTFPTMTSASALLKVSIIAIVSSSSEPFATATNTYGFPSLEPDFSIVPNVNYKQSSTSSE